MGGYIYEIVTSRCGIVNFSYAMTEEEKDARVAQLKADGEHVARIFHGHTKIYSARDEAKKTQLSA